MAVFIERLRRKRTVEHSEYSSLYRVSSIFSVCLSISSHFSVSLASFKSLTCLFQIITHIRAFFNTVFCFRLRLRRNYVFAPPRKTIGRDASRQRSGQRSCPTELRLSAQNKNPKAKAFGFLVWTNGIEPTTSCMSSMRSNQLSYAHIGANLSRSVILTHKAAFCQAFF